MRLIDAEYLAEKLGITGSFDCESCDLYDHKKEGCKKGGDFEDVCWHLEMAPTLKATIKFEPEKRL